MRRRKHEKETRRIARVPVVLRCRGLVQFQGRHVAVSEKTSDQRCISFRYPQFSSFFRSRDCAPRTLIFRISTQRMVNLVVCSRQGLSDAARRRVARVNLLPGHTDHPAAWRAFAREIRRKRAGRVRWGAAACAGAAISRRATGCHGQAPATERCRPGERGVKEAVRRGTRPETRENTTSPRSAYALRGLEGLGSGPGPIRTADLTLISRERHRCPAPASARTPHSD
jgi:hypothetical protein